MGNGRSAIEDLVIFLVTVHDKELDGEPDVGLCIVVGDEELASRAGRAMEAELSAVGRGRCVASWRKIEPGFCYRIGSLIKQAHQ